MLADISNSTIYMIVAILFGICCLLFLLGRR
jgi:hypothetical protein